MVAVIKTGHSIHRVLNYNENKVKQGVAETISAANYPMDVEQLSFKSKLNRLLNQAALNENVSRNSVHISLNFDPSEKLTGEQLKEIADAYMQKIGFQEQPYLVYQHFDSGHPHIHIVSVKVRADGSRIDTQNIGRNQSETARKGLEIQFGLVPAEKHKRKQEPELKPVNVQKLKYGKAETKRAITNVLDVVLKDYKYASLPELNAILKEYNVMADRCSENSRTFQSNGLVYRILDEQGNKVGVPIKASAFYSKPTLRYLEEKFTGNEAVRQPQKARVKNAIDLAILRNPVSKLTDLRQALDKEGIKMVLRQNETGVIYGLTYVDHRTKCVFNGSVLGKQYSAKGIMERCNEQKEAPAGEQNFVKQPAFKPLSPEEQPRSYSPAHNTSETNLLETLMQPEDSSGYFPDPLAKKGKKKRKKRISKQL